MSYDVSHLGGRRISAPNSQPAVISPKKYDLSHLGGRRIEEPVVEEEIIEELPEENAPIGHPLASLPSRTAGSFVEGMAQGANQMAAAPLLNLAGGAAQGIGKLAGYISPTAGDFLENVAQKAYEGRDYYQKPVEVFNEENPDDSIAGSFKRAGELFTPLPGGIAARGAKTAGQIGKEVLKEGLKKPALVKEALGSLGSGIALENLKDTHVLPEFTGSEALEDILKASLGRAAATKSFRLPESSENAANEFLKSKPILERNMARAFSIGAKPDPKVVKAAKEANVSIPFNINLDSKTSNFLANNVLKSFFINGRYKDVMDNAHKSMINAFENSLDKIHPEKIGREEASKGFQKSLSAEAESIGEEAKRLYSQAEKKLSSADRVVPSSTLDQIKRISSKIKVPSQSEPMKFVQKRIDALQKGWGSASNEEIKSFRKQNPGHPESFYEKISEASAKNRKQVPVEELIKQRSALMHDIQYGENARGMKAFIKPLISALDSDIEKTTNKKFLNDWRGANSYYKNEVANKIKTNLAESILDGKKPVEAIKYMNSPQDIQELARLIGKVPHKEQIMSSLKRAKFQELVGDSISNSDGSISYSKLAKFFTQKNAQQPLLKELSGKAYDDLRRLGTIAQHYVGKGKEFINPSGTAQALRGQEDAGKAVSAILSIGAGSLGGIQAGGATLLAPYVLSRIVSNPRYMESAVQYALLKKRNDLRGMERLKQKMESIFQNEILAKSIRATKKTSNIEEKHEE